MTPKRMRALQAIHNHVLWTAKPIGVSELGRKLGIHKVTALGLVNELASEGAIVRTEDAGIVPSSRKVLPCDLRPSLVLAYLGEVS